MAESISSRARFYWAVLRRLAWRWLVLAPPTILGTLQAYRDEFLPPEQQDRFRILEFLPALRWEWWIILVLMLLIALTLEGAYRLKGPDKLSADIDAQDAFDLILSRSKWAKNHRRNWKRLPRVMYERDRPQGGVIADRLQAQFEREIHKRLRNGDLLSWGSESPSAQHVYVTPEKPIPDSEWDYVRINFSQRPWNAVYYQTGSRVGELSYVGIRFCRKQILTQFPTFWY